MNYDPFNYCGNDTQSLEGTRVNEESNPKELSGVQIPREVKITTYPFTDYFKGFENVEAVREIFGHETKSVLSELRVEFYSSRFGYMGVSDGDGHLIISSHYLKHGDPLGVYLDIIHELVHVRQFKEGKPLFDETYEYVKRPTELEAYEHSLGEARRLGMTDKDIFEYLKVDWLTENEVRQLAENIGVDPPS